jgi:transposase
MTRDEFQILYDSGPEATFALVMSLQQAVDALSARVKELENRLGKDSHNSNKPPSSDGLKKKPKSLRQKSSRPSGGQPGHPGTTLCQSPNPDHVVPHSPTICCGCGAVLEDVDACGVEQRQVFDLPSLSLQVTQHQAMRKVCPACHTLNEGTFPAGVSQPVQYAERIRALCVYLQQYHLLPFARTSELLADVFDCPLSEGALTTFLAACHEQLAPVESAIKEAITDAAVANFDETGVRLDGKLAWLHSASTQSLTFYGVHEKRGKEAGKEAMDAIGILPAFTGTGVHDFFASYLGYDCDHSFCNGHLLRELIAVFEQSGPSWADALGTLLVQIKDRVDASKAAGDKHLASTCLNDFEARYQTLVEQGLTQNPAPEPVAGKRGRPKKSVARNLLERLDKHRDSVLAFMYHFDVPFDNNLAERDLRMVKVRQKVSGCFRSAAGARWFCRIRGYISTLRKQGANVLSALQSVFAGKPFIPALSA